MAEPDRLFYWVWLSLCFRPGSPVLAKLLKAADPAEFYHQRPQYDFLRPSHYNTMRAVTPEQVNQVIRQASEQGIQILSMEDPDYPKMLLQIDNPPPVLYCLGDPKINGRLAIGAVGTRESSDYYNSVVGNISYQLAQAGVVVVSGCAVGNDTYAHLGCIKGGGKTVAVLACGVDVDYPKESHHLKEQILASGGALYSELPPGCHMTRGYFTARNRLIAGLSHGVMLGQVPLRSGARLTANAAIEQGKSLFCLPPDNLYDPRCMGAAVYLREGATAVFSAKDILDELGAAFPDMQRREPPAEFLFHRGGRSAEPAAQQKNAEPKAAAPVRKEDAPAKPKETRRETAKASRQQSAPAEPPIVYAADDPHSRLLSYLTDQPLGLDDLSELCGIPMHTLLNLLTELELEGRVESLAGQRYHLAK